MNARSGARAALILSSAALLATACAPIRDHSGYLLDEPLIAAIQPGVDNRDSVAGTLGRPSFVGQFDQRDWYYISRNTRQLAFNMPRPSDQAVVRIRFDEAGNVERVDRTGIELVANITPTDQETPTLGRNRSLFEELFGNIGAVGQTGGQRGETADNPR